MRRSFAFIITSLAIACGSAEQVGSQKDAGDAASETSVEAGVCCTPDPSPGCCMRYGGWSSTGQCVEVCDGMPQPNDPSWSLATDDHGCAVWTNPKPTGGSGTCGAATPPDAGMDAQSD